MNAIFERLANIGIIPVIKIPEAQDAVPLAKALLQGGIDCAEITFRNEHAPAALAAIHQALPEMLIGAGTVLTIEQAQAARDAGAQFIVTPGFNRQVASWCLERQIPILCGVSTAFEIEQALELGLTTLKFFPAQSSGGVQKIKDLSAPYPMVHFIPTGGIGLNHLQDYLSLPCVAAVGGSFMIPQEALEQKDWKQIEISAQEAVAAMLDYRLIHLGVNHDHKEEAQKTADLLCSLFHFHRYDKPKSTFASVGFELMHQKGPGKNGHIGIYTPFPDKALYHLKKLGIQPLPETITYNKISHRINFVYLDIELSGFAIHLINPDIKMK